jgi:hypothetical protein
MKLFGFEIRKETEEDLSIPSFAPRETDDGALVVSAGGTFGTYLDLEGSAKTTLDKLDSILTINGDFTITWTLDTATKLLTARRGSHDEPMGAYFDFDFVHTLPCDNCGELMSKDIHAEELGMCIDCSNDYFTHNDEEEVEL